MLGNLGVIDREAGTVTRASILDLQTKFRLLESAFSRISRNNTAVNDSGLTTTVDFLAHTGAANHPYTDAAKTWTSVQTFTPEAVFNGGIDLGTSGSIDSNVADGVGARSFLLQPTVALTSGTDRFALRVKDSSGSGLFDIQADGSVVIVPGIGAGISGSYLSVPGVAALTTKSLGLAFNATLNNTGVTMGGLLNSCSGAMFSPSVPAAQTQTNQFGFVGSPVVSGASGTLTNAFAGLATVTRSPGHGATQTVTNLGGFYVTGIGGTSNGTVTNAYGMLVDNFGTLPAAALCHGIKIAEITTGASSAKYGILLNQSNTGYKALAIRDANAFINSDASGDLDINASANIDLNVGGTRYGNLNTTTLDFGNPTSHSLRYTLSSNVVSFNGNACLDDVPSSTSTTKWLFTSNRGDSSAKPDAFQFSAAQVNANLTNHTVWKDSGGNTILALSKVGSLIISGDLTQSAGSTWGIGDGVNAALGTTTGTKIGTGASQLLGFWNATPTTQYTAAVVTAGHTGGGGTALTHSDTFTGGTGSAAHTIGDIVKALKVCGIINT